MHGEKRDAQTDKLVCACGHQKRVWKSFLRSLTKQYLRVHSLCFPLPLYVCVCVCVCVYIVQARTPQPSSSKLQKKKKKAHMISSWMAWNDDFTMAIFPAAIIVDIAFYSLFYGLGSSAMLRSQNVRAVCYLHRVVMSVRCMRTMRRRTDCDDDNAATRSR